MSFLNPVNEPVLRFKSTDVGAPKINYNARVAGDVKAVLKACLVTGYGAIASAGWTAANEVAHVIEFVSPSATMIDYRLGIDDTSATQTAWYHQYQGARTTTSSASLKHAANANWTHADNGWQLIVTLQGLFFVEHVYSTTISAQMARLTYFGRLKSAINNTTDKNIIFWTTGLVTPNALPSRFFMGVDNVLPYTDIESYNNKLKFCGASVSVLDNTFSSLAVTSQIDMQSAVYLKTTNQVVAEQVGLLRQQ